MTFLIFFFFGSYLRIDGCTEECYLVNSMNLAISESGIAGDKLKSKLGEESIEMLDQYHQRLYVHNKKTFDEELRSSYEDVKKLLGFKLVEPKEGQSDTV